MSILIGIAGRARVGKSTLGGMIAEQTGADILAFADPLRDALFVMFGIDFDDLNGDEKERTIDWIGRSPRHLLQTLGTEWGRHHVGAHIWVRVMERHLEESEALRRNALGRWPGAVITDVRYDIEADLIRSRGGLVVHLERPEAEPVRQHRSELGATVEPGDISILNRGTLEQLAEEVPGIIETAMAMPEMP